MRLFKLLICVSFLLLFNLAFAQESSEGIKIWLEEEDGEPSNIFFKTKVTNGALTDNGDGTASLAISAGSGLTSLNGLTGGTQTFATPGTTGTAPAWVSAGTAHTLNIPMASAAGVTAGLLSKTEYDALAPKASPTFTGDLTLTDTSPSEMLCDSSDGVCVMLHLDTADTTYGIWQFWKTDTSGNITYNKPWFWGDASGNVGIPGDLTVGGELNIQSGNSRITFDNDEYIDGSNPLYTDFGGHAVITTTGNVGIGTTSPNNLLQVADLIDFNNTDSNTKLGYQAGKNIVAGAQYNTFLGHQAGLSGEGSSTNAADSNVAIGAAALYSNTVGYQNAAVGASALLLNTEGYDNAVMGYDAMHTNTTGNNNAAIGSSALYSNIGGYSNSAFGSSALNDNTSGYYNTGIGAGAGRSITTGNSNTFLGYYAGYNIAQAIDAVNSMGLGNGAYTTASNQIVIGNDDITQTLLKGNVGIGTTAPWEKLSVVGDGVFSGTSPKLVWRDTSDNTAWAWHGDTSDSTYGNLQLWLGTDDGSTGFQISSTVRKPPIYVESDGDVGIPNNFIHDQCKCVTVEDLVAADDDKAIGMFDKAVTITGISAAYIGTGTTKANITLEDGSGNAMTITGTNPTVVAHGTNAVFASVTAGNTLVAGEILRFDVTNTPDPVTDDYTLCIRYTE